MRAKIYQKQALLHLIYQKQALLHFSVLIIAVTLLLLPGNISNNELRAQPYSTYQPAFNERLTLTIDLPQTAVQYFGVLIENDNTGVQSIEYYTDDGLYPRYASIVGRIQASVGDPLTVCVMDMLTKQIACDSQIAYYDGRVSEFYVNMNYAKSVSSFAYGAIDESDTQRATTQCPCEICNTAFSGSKDFTLPPITQVSFGDDERWRPQVPCPNE